MSLTHDSCFKDLNDETLCAVFNVFFVGALKPWVRCAFENVFSKQGKRIIKKEIKTVHFAWKNPQIVMSWECIWLFLKSQFKAICRQFQGSGLHLTGRASPFHLLHLHRLHRNANSTILPLSSNYDYHHTSLLHQRRLTCHSRKTIRRRCTKTQTSRPTNRSSHIRSSIHPICRALERMLPSS